MARRLIALTLLGLAVGASLTACGTARPSARRTDGRTGARGTATTLPPSTTTTTFAVRTTTGTVFATAPDPTTGAPVALAFDAATPVATRRRTPRHGWPLLVFVHGGGFVTGTRQEVTPEAEAWARRGYVTMNVDYRLTPGNPCVALGRGQVAAADLDRATQQCRDAAFVAQHDVQAAVRWARAHARALDIDPDRIGVVGFSAGALTAVHLATRADDPGTVGDDLGQDSSVQAAIAASGCSLDEGAIDRKDAPVYLAASELDPLVPYRCVTTTEAALRTAGVTVVSRTWPGEGTHALTLYRAHRDELDVAWSAFLAEHLRRR